MSERLHCPMLSVVIPNFNYGEFLGDAIESALSIEWSNVEIIVVDDGSVDSSLEVAKSYGSRIRLISQANSGHRQACENGFRQSSGEWILFLDSDDLVRPGIMAQVSGLLDCRVSKVQFKLGVVDRFGKEIGSSFPSFTLPLPSGSQIRAWAIRSSAYPTPPGSGNIYNRKFVSSAFEMATHFDDSFSDSVLLAAAPFLGDVATYDGILAFYRVHGRNSGAMDELVPSKFSRETKRSIDRFRFMQMVAAHSGYKINNNAINRSIAFLQYRIASFYVAGDAHPIISDTPWKILKDFSVAVITPQGKRVMPQIALFVWACLLLMAPPVMRNNIILYRFAAQRTPKSLRRLLRMIGVRKG